MSLWLAFLHAHAGRLATVGGTVVRMSPVRPLITEMAFTCGKCGTRLTVAYPDRKCALPTKCSGEVMVHVMDAGKIRSTARQCK